MKPKKGIPIRFRGFHDPKITTKNWMIQEDSQPDGNIKSMKGSSKVLMDEIKDITSIGLATKATSILEKVLWITILLIGTLWACYFITIQFELWDAQPFIVTKADVSLAELSYPAMTICSHGSTKYAIAERLGNYIDPESDVLEKALSISLQNLIICATLKGTGYEWNKKFDTYSKDCLKDRFAGCKV